MRKITTVLEAYLDDNGMIQLQTKYINTYVTPKYIIPTSNFDDAYLIGIPCKVLSTEYTNKSGRTVYDVMSTVTGIEYTIPTGWAHEYNTLEEANLHSHIKGSNTPSVTNLIGKKYLPHDNSWNLDFEGKWSNLVKKECEIVSVPFKDKTYDEYPIDEEVKNKERTFILVKYNGKVHRVLFEEWDLIEEWNHNNSEFEESDFDFDF